MKDVSWLDGMNDEDLSFLKRFLLASGSLKQLAKDYGISYPTIRLRLDRLIEKVKVYESVQDESRFEQTLKLFYAEGKIDMQVLKALREAHRSDSENDESQ